MAKPKMNLLALICGILFRLGDRHRSANSPEIATAAPCKAMVPITIGVDIGNERRNEKKKRKKKERKFCLTPVFLSSLSLFCCLSLLKVPSFFFVYILHTA